MQSPILYCLSGSQQLYASIWAQLENKRKFENYFWIIRDQHYNDQNHTTYYSETKKQVNKNGFLREKIFLVQRSQF